MTMMTMTTTTMATLTENEGAWNWCPFDRKNNACVDIFHFPLTHFLSKANSHRTPKECSCRFEQMNCVEINGNKLANLGQTINFCLVWMGLPTGKTGVSFHSFCGRYATESCFLHGRKASLQAGFHPEPSRTRPDPPQASPAFAKQQVA